MAVGTAFHKAGPDTFSKMPGHWLLASMGKKVLRPGGLELTTWMLNGLKISEKDDVVELAPGMGRTAQITLKKQPKTYTAVERDEEAAEIVRNTIAGPGRSIQLGDASATGLKDQVADVLYGEAFLTMQSAQMKQKILNEIARVLRPGGRYGIHEMALETQAQDEAIKIQQELSTSIRVNAKPISIEEWKALLESAGFEIKEIKTLPMNLLELDRLIADEGLFGALKLGFNLLKNPGALARVKDMRRNFRSHGANICAIGIIAEKR